MISAIVAVDQNWGIGYNGDLLEHIPEDLKYFKELTTNNIVVMGRKTWDSLPKTPLPNRLNIILSRHYIEPACENTLCMNMDNLIYCLKNHTFNEEWFIIGGGQIYQELLPFCDRVYVTKIERSHKDVDTYFPNLDKMPEWEVSSCTELRMSDDIPYAFLTYDRIS